MVRGTGCGDDDENEDSNSPRENVDDDEDMEGTASCMPTTSTAGSVLSSQQLLDAIRKIKQQKQRPNLERICHAVMQCHKVSKALVEELLEKAVREGVVEKVVNKGLCSYKDPSWGQPAGASSSSSSAAATGGTAAGSRAIASQHQQPVHQPSQHRAQMPHPAQHVAAGGSTSDDKANMAKLVVKTVRELGDSGRDVTLKAVEAAISKSGAASAIEPATLGRKIRIAVKRALTLGLLDKDGKSFKVRGTASTAVVADTSSPGSLGLSGSLLLADEDLDKPRASPRPVCSYCLGTREKNRSSEAEELISCADCGQSGHPSCLKFSADLTRIVKQLRWQCPDCKTCSACRSAATKEPMTICEACDRGFHLQCCQPPLLIEPQGPWTCNACTALAAAAAAAAAVQSLPSVSKPAVSSRLAAAEVSATSTKHKKSSGLSGRAPVKPGAATSSGSNASKPRSKASNAGKEGGSSFTSHSPKAVVNNIALTQQGKVSCQQQSQLLLSENISRNHANSDDEPTPAPSGDDVGKTEASDVTVGLPMSNLPAGVTASDYALFKKAQELAASAARGDVAVGPGGTVPVTGSRFPPCIEFGKYEVQTWYSSPYPQEYAQLPKLYICEYCLKYMKSRQILQRHMEKCGLTNPPANEIYRKNSISVFEVDGNSNKIYCQNLCLLAKLFLDHKTLYYDVEPFLFYVLTLNDDEGCHLVGYFSKEKQCQQKYNLSCIMTLPQHQRKGYGRFLIDFSYLLSRVEGRPGSPEKPLSELGRISYMAYWKSVVTDYVSKHYQEKHNISIKGLITSTCCMFAELSQKTGMCPHDIASTLVALDMVARRQDNSGFTILVPHLSSKATGLASPRANEPNLSAIDSSVSSLVDNSAKRLEADEEYLRWTPLVRRGLSALPWTTVGSRGTDDNEDQEKEAETNPFGRRSNDISSTTSSSDEDAAAPCGDSMKRRRSRPVPSSTIGNIKRCNSPGSLFRGNTASSHDTDDSFGGEQPDMKKFKASDSFGMGGNTGSADPSFSRKAEASAQCSSIALAGDSATTGDPSVDKLFSWAPKSLSSLLGQEDRLPLQDGPSGGWVSAPFAGLGGDQSPAPSFSSAAACRTSAGSAVSTHPTPAALSSAAAGAPRVTGGDEMYDASASDTESSSSSDDGSSSETDDGESSSSSGDGGGSGVPAELLRSSRACEESLRRSQSLAREQAGTEAGVMHQQQLLPQPIPSQLPPPAQQLTSQQHEPSSTQRIAGGCHVDSSTAAAAGGNRGGPVTGAAYSSVIQPPMSASGACVGDTRGAAGDPHTFQQAPVQQQPHRLQQQPHRPQQQCSIAEPASYVDDRRPCDGSSGLGRPTSDFATLYSEGGRTEEQSSGVGSFMYADSRPSIADSNISRHAGAAFISAVHPAHSHASAMHADDGSGLASVHTPTGPMPSSTSSGVIVESYARANQHQSNYHSQQHQQVLLSMAQRRSDVGIAPSPGQQRKSRHDVFHPPPPSSRGVPLESPPLSSSAGSAETVSAPRSNGSLVDSCQLSQQQQQGFADCAQQTSVASVSSQAPPGGYGAAFYLDSMAAMACDSSGGYRPTANTAGGNRTAQLGGQYSGGNGVSGSIQGNASVQLPQAGIPNGLPDGRRPSAGANLSKQQQQQRRMGQHQAATSPFAASPSPVQSHMPPSPHGQQPPLQHPPHGHQQQQQFHMQSSPLPPPSPLAIVPQSPAAAGGVPTRHTAAAAYLTNDHASTYSTGGRCVGAASSQSAGQLPMSGNMHSDALVVMTPPPNLTPPPARPASLLSSAGSPQPLQAAVAGSMTSAAAAAAHAAVLQHQFGMVELTPEVYQHYRRQLLDQQQQPAVTAKSPTASVASGPRAMQFQHLSLPTTLPTGYSLINGYHLQQPQAHINAAAAAAAAAGYMSGSPYIGQPHLAMPFIHPAAGAPGMYPSMQHTANMYGYNHR